LPPWRKAAPGRRAGGCRHALLGTSEIDAQRDRPVLQRRCWPANRYSRRDRGGRLRDDCRPAVECCAGNIGAAAVQSVQDGV
jgi:hypothetical protein